MNQNKIISRLTQLELFAGLILQEATMLKQELLGVVSDSSTRKGLSDSEIMKIKMKAEKRRAGK